MKAFAHLPICRARCRVLPLSAPCPCVASKQVNKFDVNADKEIDPEEWAAITQQMPPINDKDTVESIKASFGILAKCKEGDEATASIDTAELEYVMTNLGAKLNAEDAKLMVTVRAQRRAISC